MQGPWLPPLGWHGGNCDPDINAATVLHYGVSFGLKFGFRGSLRFNYSMCNAPGFQSTGMGDPDPMHGQCFTTDSDSDADSDSDSD